MRLFKSFTILILSFAIIIVIAFYFYQKSVWNSLDQKNKHVTQLWNNFKSDLKTRDSLLVVSISDRDSLKYWLQNSVHERKTKENNADLVFYEYKVNEFIMTHFPDRRQVLDLNNKLNSDISKYNSETGEYNKYISIFPNFIIARKHNYHKAKYFDITYGNINKDPIQESKELPEWAKGIDTN